MEKKARHNLLTSLPLSIIHNILALVPIREAVRTSILSKQWRYIWATLPRLVFDDECATDKTSLGDFVNQALLLHEGPIHEFKLSSCESLLVDQWLLVLSRNDVRMLNLNAEDCLRSLKIHSSVYYCENLTHLELRNCEVPPPPPTFNGFSCLRCLILHDVESSPCTIETFVTNSPLLEELDWNNGREKLRDLELKIHAPNLKSLTLNIDCKEFCLYAPLLATLWYDLFTEDFKPKPLRQKSSDCNYTKVFRSLTNLEEFTAQENFVKYLSIGIEPSHQFLVFHRLRIIDVSDVMFSDVGQIWVVVRLITGAPNLESLSITFDTDDGSNHTPEAAVSFWDSNFASEFRFGRLKSIELDHVYGDINELKLAEFLLASSPALEKLSITTFNNDGHKALKLTAELPSYPRASTKAKILFSTRKSYSRA